MRQAVEIEFVGEKAERQGLLSMPLRFDVRAKISQQKPCPVQPVPFGRGRGRFHGDKFRNRQGVEMMEMEKDSNRIINWTITALAGFGIAVLVFLIGYLLADAMAGGSGWRF